MPLMSNVRTRMSQRSPIELQLQELELSLLQPIVRKSERLAEFLAEGFVEFGSSGRTFNKEQVIAGLRAEAITPELTATQVKVQLLAPLVALVTYRVHRHSEPPVHTLRSSIWQQQAEGQWQMVFHQGTLTAAPE
jgi:hypothetical protein